LLSHVGIQPHPLPFAPAPGSPEEASEGGGSRSRRFGAGRAALAAVSTAKRLAVGGTEGAQQRFPSVGREPVPPEVQPEGPDFRAQSQRRSRLMRARRSFKPGSSMAASAAWAEAKRVYTDGRLHLAW
jgi:hypothetical protein